MKYFKWQNAIFNLCILLNCLLIFLLFFSSNIHVPVLLQVLGRAHPLMLHFPIVLLLMAFVFELAAAFSKKQPLLLSIANWVLLGACLAAVITALMGLFLSRESGYDGDELNIHKWTGVTCALLGFLWYALRNTLRKSKIATVTTGLGTVVVLLVAGHKGADLTHGKSFLLAPITATETAAPIPLEDAVIYAHMVKPILEQKCIGCHNKSKAKGELVMETTQSLLKGGKNGKLWDLNAANLGLMMRRIHLPVEDKEHMSPKGKPQLTDEEIKVIYLWIKAGASFTKKVTALPENDSLRTIAKAMFKNSDADKYDFQAPDQNTLTRLNTDYRVVKLLASESPAVQVNFYGATQFKSQQLKDLTQIKTNIVSLQLSKMPVTDEDLKIIGTYTNLRSLNLSFTAIKGDGLKYLNGLQNLKELSLSGTGINAGKLKPLAQLKKLKSVQIWNTAINDKDMVAIKSDFKATHFDIGYRGDTVVARLSSPIVVTEKRTFKNSLSVTIKSPIKSAVIRYTLNGSEPDSLNSNIYNEPISINQTSVLKTKSYLQGWIGSSTIEESFYKVAVIPDSVQLLTQPASQYAAKKGATLIDGELGTKVFAGSNKWLGYKETPLEAYLHFKQPVNVSSLRFEMLVDIGNYIMPPYEIQIWGGNSIQALHLLKKSNPKQPNKEELPYVTSYEDNFPTQKVQLIKLIIKPVGSLPQWHGGKGQKAWIFLDEIFLN